MYSLCMKGNIYAGKKCPCGGTMRHNERKHNCFCAKCGMPHTGSYIVRYPKISKRCKTYNEASRFLTGLRFKEDEGTLDTREYRADNPLSFSQQIDKWLAIKKQTLNPRSFSNLRRYIYKALDFIGDKNIKYISSGDIEDF